MRGRLIPAGEPGPPAAPRAGAGAVLVGGVGQLFQGDLDLGRRAVDRLAVEVGDSEEVRVEELHYGAVAVAQRLEELEPRALVLVGAEARGDRPPGTVVRRVVEPTALDPEAVQRAVGDAVTGYVAIDLVVEVAQGLGCLPEDTVVIEVEPERTASSEELTPAATRALDEAVAMVAAELDRLGVPHRVPHAGPAGR